MKTFKYFSLPEFLKSTVARSYGIDNTPPKETEYYLGRLVSSVLDPLRERWGSPIIVSSGYRCPALNAKVGGEEASYHLRGMAADIYPRNGRTHDLYELVMSMYIGHAIGLTECYYDAAHGYIHIAFDPDYYSMCPFI